MTINGVSTCQTAGTEKYESFQMGIGRKRRTFVQYDYRHTDGELFSCVKPTLHTAVITSEYNMPCVKEWLTHCTTIADMREF